MQKRKPWIELIVVLALIAFGIAHFQKRELVEPDSRPSPSTTPKIAATATPVIETTPGALTTPKDHPRELLPLKGKMPPALTESTTVLVQTDAGDYTLQVFPQAAPNAVARFLKLVEIGFYNNTPVSRVVPGFVVQFGINPNMAEWKKKHFQDDPSLFQHLPGTIAFAKAGPNTNSTQVFINLSQNNRLAEPSMNFTVFGIVTKGFATVESSAEVGEPGMGLDQNRLWADPEYLESLEQKPTMITSMTIVD